MLARKLDHLAVLTASHHEADTEKESRFAVHTDAVGSTTAKLETVISKQIHDPSLPVAYNWTVYLDTNDGWFSRSQPGAPTRRLRIRVYAAARTDTAAPEPVGKSFLELKERSDGTRRKVRLAVSLGWIDSLFSTGFTSCSPLTELARIGDVPWFDELDHRTVLQPTLVTCYRRSSFIGQGGRVRATLDDMLAFCQPEDARGVTVAGWPRHVVSMSPHSVLELKWFGELSPRLAEIAEPLTTLDDGKFRTGTRALRGLAYAS